MKRILLAASVFTATTTLLTLPVSTPVYAAPDLTVTVSAPATALIDTPSTPVEVSVSAANPTGVNGFNVGYRAVLPAGATYGGTSSAGSPVQYPQVGGSTVLWWENVSDILANSSGGFTFSVLATNASFPVNGVVSIPVTAYIHSDPRTIPTLNGSGVIQAATQSGTGSGTAATTITAIDIEKSEPSAEGELLRGIHDHETVYTLTITGNGANPDNAVVVDDYLDAGLEFLGCGAWDNTTDAPTNSGSALEYPGAPTIAAGVAPDLVAGAPDHCLQPALVETVNVDPDGAGPLPTGVYTHVRWNLGTLAVDEVRTIQYYAGVPMRENTLTWTGTTPATTCTVSNCPQAANLDNNGGAETTDDQDLPNHAIVTGTYTGTVAPATSTSVSDRSTVTATAEDLRILKGVDAATIVRDGISRWTLDIATGEYRRVDGPVTVVDTLPDGLCPLDTVNHTSGNQASDAQCDPVVGETPTLAYTGAPVENADGSWTITWVLPSPTFTTSDTFQIAFSSRARVHYQQNFLDAAPVLANDGWTNTVDILPVNAQLDVPAPGLPAANPTDDTSSAGQTAPNPGIQKDVANPPTSGTLNCNTATWRDADDDASAATYYRPGDRVCYRIQLQLNDTGIGTELQYRDVNVTDYLPPGFVFEQYWGTNPATGETSGDTIANVSALAVENTTAGQLLTWQLGTTTPDGRFVDADAEPFFEVVFSATIPLNGGAGGAFVSRANLAKATTSNTPGSATSLREVAVELTTRPALSLDKSRTPAGTVATGSSVTYTVAVRNDAPAEAGGTTFGAARNVLVRDVLPYEISCADVATPIPNGGVCTDGVTTGVTPSPARSVIDWTIAGPINPQATSSLSYVVNLDDDLAPSEDLTNTAGVRSYDQPVNTGGPDVRYVPPTATTVDPTAVPNDTVPALDTETISLTNVSMAKLQQSSITETGNPSNASLVNTAETVTVGEEIAYRVTATIPANSTVYGSPTFTDTLPSGFRLLTSPAPTATLNGLALPGGWSFNPTTLAVTLPASYVTDGTQDVIAMEFRVVVEDVAANAEGLTRTNNTAFNFITKADDMNVVVQARTRTASANAVVREPRPTITKNENDADDFVVPGQTVTYTLTVGNDRTTPGHDLVVTDCVPNNLVVQTPITPPATPVGVTVVDAAGGPGCATGTFITWTFPTTFALNAGATTSMSYDVVVANSLVAATTLRNDAGVTFDSTEGVNPDDRSYSATTFDEVTISNPGLSKSHTPNPVTIGQTATYTLEVTLPANVLIYDSVVVDDMPGGLSFEGMTGITCAPAACPPVTVLGATAPANGPTVGYWLGDVGPYAAEQTITITYDATVLDQPGNTSGDAFINTADTRWNRTNLVVGTPASIPATHDVTLTPVADILNLVEPRLLIDKDVALTGCNTTAAPASAGTDDDACDLAPSGTGFTYTLTVENTGTSPAYQMRIVDDADLPSSAFASLTVTNAGGTTVVDSSIVDGDGLEFTAAGPLAAGARLTITYDVTLRASASLSQLQQVLNTAGVPTYEGVSTAAQTAILATYPSRDFRTYTENPTDADTVTLHYPQPTIVKTAVSDASDARIGSPFTWQLLIGNADSTATLFAYDVVDTLPAGWSYVPGSSQISAVTGGATPAAGALADPVVAGQNLSWTDLGNVPAGATVTVRFQAVPTAVLETVPTTGSFAHVNTATVAGSDATGATANADGPYDDTDTATALIRRVDLSLDKSITPAAGPYAFGQDVTYTLVVTNNGPDASTGSVVGDVLPVGLTYRSIASISQGTLNPTTLDWTVGALANGASATLVINVELEATGSLTNVAEIESDEQWDPNSTPGNGSTTEDDDDSVTITVVPTSLGDRVWLDLDNDGVQDGGEPGIPNVTLELRDAGPNGTFGDGDDGATVTTATDAAGDYGFGGLRIDRNYRVSVVTATLPPGLTPTYDLDGLGTANTATTTVPTTTANLLVDFGYTGVGSIGDTVWIDLDASGGATRQLGEPGIGGIDLTVTWAGFDTVLGTADDIVFPTATGAAGDYLVPNLPYGDYRVDVDPASLPAGLTATFDLDGIGGASLNTAAATLSAGNPNELDVDFSYTGGAVLGDRVWLDLDGDGTQDAGEPGIPGLTVELTWFGADGTLDAGPGGDDVVTTTTTGADGLYLFVNLPAGNFQVAVTPPAGVTATYDLDGLGTPDVALTTLTTNQARNDVDFGYVGVGSIGDRVWWDVAADGDGTFNGVDRPLAGVDLTITWAGADAIAGNADDIAFARTTDAAGNYLVDGIPTGAYTVTVDAASLPAGLDVETYDLDGIGTAGTAVATLTTLAPDRLDVDFSYTGAGSIGDTVWYDVDGDGASAPAVGDPLLAGVAVTVTWLGPDGQPGGGDDVTYTDTTDASGAYLVANLPFGAYTVALGTASLPAGLDVPTHDLDGTATAHTTAASIDALAPNELDADFAVTGSGSLGDTVYLDLDGDGTQDAGEPGLPGIDVTLSFTAPGGSTVTLTATTDASGRYLFDRLPAGTYTVTVDPGTLPAGVAPTVDLDGIATANTTAVVLAANQDRTDADFGYRGVASIGDRVWWEFDLDGDGSFDAGDVPMAGVSVGVEWAGSDGVFGTGDEVTIDVVTDAAGLYLVEGLPYGDYRVAVDPATLEPGVDVMFDLDGIATPNVAERTLDIADPDARDVDFSYAGTGSIGDTVWHDRDADGVVDAGEEPLAGVAVTVVWAGPDGIAGNADDVTFTDTTDASGQYLVDALPPGSYTVSIDPATLPAGFVATFDADGGRDRSATVTLAAGEDRTDVDFGEREEADLAVSKSHTGGPFAPGDEVTFTITVRNLGPGVARDVRAVDALPVGLTAVTATGTGWQCNVAATVVCAAADPLATGATAPVITVTTTVDADVAATSVTNTATVSTSTPDPVTTNDRDVDAVQIYRLDLSITKELVGELVGGRSVSYRLTVANNGPVIAALGDIRVVDALPAELTPTAASGLGFTCSIAGATVTCTSTTPMAIGESRVIDVTANVASGVVGRSVTNTATVASLVTGDVVPTNNIDQATGLVVNGDRLPTAGANVRTTIVTAIGLLLLGGALVAGTTRRRRLVAD